MRRLLASLVVVLAALAVPTTAHAATPLDPLPITMGTFTGMGGCDHGCFVSLDLTGRFRLDGGSVQTTAHFEYRSADDDVRWTASIAGPRFTGSCQVQYDDAGVQPSLTESYDRSATCIVVWDGGSAPCTVSFGFKATDLLDSSDDESGSFYPRGLDPVVDPNVC
jgi:hypothetical protein